MSMSRIVRYAVAFAVVLAISAQAAQAAAPDHLRWKGQDVGQIGPTRGPMIETPTRVVHAGGGNGFAWTAALAGAGSAVGFLLLAGGAVAGVRSRRRVAIS
jgi:hypothetical protein